MISIVLPAKNEEKRIHRPLRTYTCFKDMEIIVVSNGSTDTTCDIVRSFARTNSNIRLLEFPNPLGKGGAVLKGLECAQGNIIGFVDSDDAFGAGGTRTLINAIKRGRADCAIASKWRDSSFTNIPERAGRKLLSRGWNFLIFLFLGMVIRDTQSGAKFFTKAAFERIDRKFLSNGFEFDVELLFKFKREGLSIREITLPVHHVKGSTFAGSYIPEMFINLMKLFVKYRLLREDHRNQIDENVGALWLGTITGFVNEKAV